MDKRLKTRWGLLVLGTVVLLFCGNYIFLVYY